MFQSVKGHQKSVLTTLSTKKIGVWKHLYVSKCVGRGDAGYVNTVMACNQQ